MRMEICVDHPSSLVELNISYQPAYNFKLYYSLSRHVKPFLSEMTDGFYYINKLIRIQCGRDDSI